MNLYSFHPEIEGDRYKLVTKNFKAINIIQVRKHIAKREGCSLRYISYLGDYFDEIFYSKYSELFYIWGLSHSEGKTFHTEQQIIDRFLSKVNPYL